MNPQLLLFAEPLLRDGLTRLIEAEMAPARVVSDPSVLDAAPQLVIWAPDAATSAATLSLELQRFKERWQPAPLLLLLPAGHRLSAAELLQLPAAGLLDAPEPGALVQAVNTLLAGGQVCELRSSPPTAGANPSPIGLGQMVLLSGLQQVDAEIHACQRLLAPASLPLVQRLVLEGRLRELGSARSLLLLLWGPASLAWSDQGLPAAGATDPPPRGTALTLQQRNAEGIWSSLLEQLSAMVTAGPANRSGQLLALQALRPERRGDLLLALLNQLGLVREQLAGDGIAAAELESHWQDLQSQLRQQALRAMASPYVQLPLEGQLLGVAEQLIRTAELDSQDPELPPAQPMLAALVHAQPLLVEGQLLPADDWRALLHLQLLVSNWLVRSGELLAAEVLACSAAWPELRRYLLQPELLSTRNLERLRNQLNAQQRWQTWWQRPVALYESRRTFYALQEQGITSVDHTEPRDRELRQLAWAQQLVPLALETRDALAPQVQALAKGLGDLLVVLLTQVLGRAIGLVGRGIVQGMGRSLRASQ